MLIGALNPCTVCVLFAITEWFHIIYKLIEIIFISPKNTNRGIREITNITRNFVGASS